jgi:hypothetical protein
MNTAQLKELGFTKAAAKVDKAQDFKRKLAVAYEHHKVVTPQVWDRFQKALKAKTGKITNPCPKCFAKGKEDMFYRKDPNELKKMLKLASRSNQKACECGYCQGTGAERLEYDRLVGYPIEEYSEVPPMDCLMDLKTAKDRNCFDTFEVAKVESVVERPDPIIFGRIEGCPDRFFITQWDDDVSIEQILQENVG